MRNATRGENGVYPSRGGGGGTVSSIGIGRSGPTFISRGIHPGETSNGLKKVIDVDGTEYSPGEWAARAEQRSIIERLTHIEALLIKLVEKG